MRASSRIRNTLRANENGLTIVELAVLLDMANENVRTAIQNMPDVYIDRWEQRGQGPISAVWCAVYVPPHAPRPPTISRERILERQRESTRDYRERKREAELTGLPMVLKAPKRERVVKEPVQPRGATRSKPAEKPFKFQLSGLTQIRGPWPTHH